MQVDLKKVGCESIRTAVLALDGCEKWKVFGFHSTTSVVMIDFLQTLYGRVCKERLHSSLDRSIFIKKKA